MKSVINASFILYCLLVAQACIAADVYETINVSKGDTLFLNTDVGSIDVNTHTKNAVIINAEVSGEKADDFSISIDKSSREVRVIGEKDTRYGWNWGDLHVRFTITVPEEFNIDLRTSGGGIEIENIIGNIDADTSGGSIEVGNVQGDVRLNTSGGSISTRDIYGEIDANTSGGSINVSFARQPREDASLTTSGGSIRASLPEDIAVDIDASTSGGRVSSEFYVDGKNKKQSIKGAINGGGPHLELHTSGGSIRIEKR